MTMFRCAVRADEGPAFVRLVQASSREKAILLLLAQGLEPLSVTPDVPSLVTKLVRRLNRGGRKICAAQALPYFVATGLSLDAAISAWSALPGHADIPACVTLPDLVEAGEPLSLALEPCENIPRWMIGVLALAKNRDDEQAILLALADIQSQTARGDRWLRRRGSEGACLLFVSALLASAAFPISSVAAIAVVTGMMLLALLPDGPVGRTLREARAARMLAVMAMLQLWGSDPAHACDLASRAACDTRTRRQIEDNLTQFAAPLRLDLMIGGPLGLPPMDAAILRHGAPAVACRHLSLALTARLRGRANSLIHSLRLCALALATLALVAISA